MKRRHLFDNGFPVSTPTLLAGSEVLLAISRASLRKSRRRLGLSCLLLADTLERVDQSYTRLVTHANHTEADRRLAADAENQPRQRAASETPHQP